MKLEGLVKAAVALLLIAGLTVGCSPMEKIGYKRMRDYNEVVDGLQNARAEIANLNGDREALGSENSDLRRRTTELSQQLAAANQEKLAMQRDLEQSRANSSRLDTQLAGVQADLKRLTSLSMFEWNPNNNSLVVRAHFALGSAEIQAADRRSLAKAADAIKKIPASYTIHIDGHTDDLPVKHPKTRADHGDLWGLGAHRALAVLRVLQTHGVDSNRMVARSFADRDPLVPGSTVAARRQNRRVEISIAPTMPTAHLASIPK